MRSLATLAEVGLGYLRLGQPATEFSGGEAQRIKLATELQRTQRGTTLYLLDEPTSGLHPADVELLVGQLDRLVDLGNTVVVVEHDMDVVARRRLGHRSRSRRGRRRRTGGGGGAPEGGRRIDRQPNRSVPPRPSRLMDSVARSSQVSFR